MSGRVICYRWEAGIGAHTHTQAQAQAQPYRGLKNRVSSCVTPTRAHKHHTPETPQTPPVATFPLSLLLTRPQPQPQQPFNPHPLKPFKPPSRLDRGRAGATAMKSRAAGPLAMASPQGGLVATIDRHSLFVWRAAPEISQPLNLHHTRPYTVSLRGSSGIGVKGLGLGGLAGAMLGHPWVRQEAGALSGILTGGG